MPKFLLKKSIVYAARCKSDQEVYKSSSGAIFPVLATYFLKKGNAVVSALYNYSNDTVEYKLYTDINTMNLSRGSKYIASNPNNILKTIAHWLNNNQKKKIIIFGLRCHIAGFQSYLMKKGLYNRCTFVDIICHGSASQLIWKENVDFLKKKYNGNIKYVGFKDKRKGWSNPTAFININNKEILIKEYTKLFYEAMIMRPSCYKCPYCSVDGSSDITIGDYWGINTVFPDMYSEKGTSLVIIHTTGGFDIFNNIKESLIYRLSNSKDCIQPHLLYPVKIPHKAKDFWKDYRIKGINFVLKKYGTESFFEKLLNKKNRLIIKLKICCKKFLQIR